MSILQFNDYQIAKVLDSNETIEMGAYRPDKKYRLKYVRVFIHKTGTIGGSETLKVGFHGSTDLSSALVESSTASLSTIQNSSNLNTTGAWLAWIRFDFTGIVLNPNRTYYLSLTAANYTRNATTYFICVPYNYPDPTYTQGITINNFNEAPLSFEVFGNLIT